MTSTSNTPVLSTNVCPEGDHACEVQGCIEHPRHDGNDHTYEQHHDLGDHVGDGPCMCSQAHHVNVVAHSYDIACDCTDGDEYVEDIQLSDLPHDEWGAYIWTCPKCGFEHHFDGGDVGDSW